MKTAEKPGRTEPLVRPAVFQDLAALASIDARCFPAGIAFSRKQIAALLLSPAVRAWVAELSGAIAGFSMLELSSHRPAAGELITMEVLPEFRRARIAWQLHETLEGWLCGAGIRSIALHVAVDNVGAIRFYQRLGYTAGRRVPSYYPGRLDAWSMQKLLQ